MFFSSKVEYNLKARKNFGACSRLTPINAKNSKKNSKVHYILNFFFDKIILNLFG